LYLDCSKAHGITISIIIIIIAIIVIDIITYFTILIFIFLFVAIKRRPWPSGKGRWLQTTSPSPQRCWFKSRKEFGFLLVRKLSSKVTEECWFYSGARLFLK
jgi:hypothetical protein